MKDVNVLSPLVCEVQAAEVVSYECTNCKKSRRGSRLRKLLLTFFTFMIIPMCQSMPTQLSVTYIQHQDLQIVSGNHNISKKAN